MKTRILMLIILFLSHHAFADGVWDSLRELRGTVREVTGTAREAQELSKEIGIGQGESAQNQASKNLDIQAGDVVMSKITNLAIYKEANKKSSILVRANKSDELVFMGEESNGFLRVTTDKGEGWAEKILIKKN
jgi:co-chaperonin GroES (HSP10)